MGSTSKIQWTDATWTPVRARHRVTNRVGWHCEHVTAGCEFCYAENMNTRLGTGLPFKPGHRKDVEIFLDPNMLLAPLKDWRAPRMVFVCSMTDLFADFVTDFMLDKMFAVMIRSRHHIFQVLTKRSRRMQEYLSDLTIERLNDALPSLPALPFRSFSWLANVWCGVSCEHQEAAELRIPDLLLTPAAVHFVSAEPLIGPIDFDRIQFGEHTGVCSALTFADDQPRLDWIIVGGESGRSARVMDLAWVTQIVDACELSGVDCFVKQMGDKPVLDGIRLKLAASKGGDPEEWPERFRVRKMPGLSTTEQTQGALL